MGIFSAYRGTTFPTLGVAGPATVDSLNVGAATGAGSGDVRASGAVNAGSATNTTAGNVAGSGVLAMTGSGVNTLSGKLTVSGQPVEERTRSTAQAVTTATSSAIDFATSAQHTGDVSYSGGVFTIGTTGTYAIVVTLIFSASAAGRREVRILINGSVYKFTAHAASPSGESAVTCTMVKLLGATTTVTIHAYQDSGGTLNVGGSANGVTSCEITKIS